MLQILGAAGLAGAVMPRALAQGASAVEGAAPVDIPAPVVGRGPATPFDPADIVARARDLASRAFEEPATAPKEWGEISYDQYNAFLFDDRSAIWFGEETDFEVELRSPGLYYSQAVPIHVVESGAASELIYDSRVFTRTDQVPDLPESPALGYSGFQLKHPINRVWQMEEFSVFQGASYFRAIGAGQLYGLSARGLALRTGDPDGEEFPFFRAFWLERPDVHARAITVHALLDSQSVAGAYRFRIEPGRETVMEVEAELFPRVALDNVGIAPQTSMFLFDETNRSRFDDFRPAVHDSDGLLVVNGAGEHLWRKLANPKALQISSFVDDSPRGFGLMQRKRDADDFADLEAKYHIRPSLWVEPLGDWGPGAVTLVEIPADREIYDNVVAFWQPRQALEPIGDGGVGHRHRYRLYWGEDPDVAAAKARVANTWLGGQPFDTRGGGRHVAIEFDDHHLILPDVKKMEVHVSSDVLAADAIGTPVVNRNPDTGGARLDFIFYPGDAQAVELRAQLLQDGRAASEVWLYRWTA